MRQWPWCAGDERRICAAGLIERCEVPADQQCPDDETAVGTAAHDRADIDRIGGVVWPARLEWQLVTRVYIVIDAQGKCAVTGRRRWRRWLRCAAVPWRCRLATRWFGGCGGCGLGGKRLAGQQRDRGDGQCDSGGAGHAASAATIEVGADVAGDLRSSLISCHVANARIRNDLHVRRVGQHLP